MISVPNVLKDFTGFVDGFGTAGKITKLSLPKLAIKTDEHRGGGMDGSVEIDMGLDKMEAGAEFAEYLPDLMAVLGTGKLLTARGSIEGPDGKIPVVAKMRGLWKEVDMGDWQPGDKSSLKMATAVNVYKLIIGARTVFDIDVAAGKRIIDGIDQLAQRRANLGV